MQGLPSLLLNIMQRKTGNLELLYSVLSSTKCTLESAMDLTWSAHTMLALVEVMLQLISLAGRRGVQAGLGFETRVLM